MIAETIGIVVGAATCRRSLSEEQLCCIARRLSELLSPSDATDAAAARGRLSAALAAGRNAVATGRIDADDVAAVLNKLKYRLFAEAVIS
jgi:hypothetical protein